MASHPDLHPDSIPSGSDESPEQVSPVPDPGRENVEEDSPGDPGGTAGTGGDNKVQDAEFER